MGFTIDYEMYKLEFVGISVNLVLLQKIKHIDKERSGKWTLK